MATNPTLKTPSEVAREREVFKYYQPPSPKHDANSTPLARPSHDAALNSFAQCAALRLNVKYCMISLFTRVSQYIIAEATKTVSFQNEEDSLDKYDKLWRGVEVIPRKTGPSSGAFSFFCKPERPEFLVYPNLLFDDAYGKLPYVSGPPGMRFYAAVPLTSPLGIIIGTFAVFDTVSRTEIIVAELQFLKDMSATTMQHLEVCRAQQKSARAETMIKGLGLYIEGKSSLRDWWLVTGHKSHRTFKTNSRFGRNLGQLADDEFGLSAPRDDRGGAARYYNVIDNSRPSPPNDDDDSASQTLSTLSAGESDFSNSIRSMIQDKSTRPTTASLDLLDDETSEYGDTSTLSAGKSRRARSNSGASRLQDAVLTSDLKDTFSRASNLIRESMSVEGCLFLDASVGTFGGRSEKVNMQHQAPPAWNGPKSPVITSSSDEERNHTPDKGTVKSNATNLAGWVSLPSGSNTMASDQRTNQSALHAVIQANAVNAIRNDFAKTFTSTSTGSSMLDSSPRLSAAVTFQQREIPQSSLRTEIESEGLRADIASSLPKACGILGYSTPTRSSLNMHLPSDQHLTVRENFLQSLLKRYPHGRVFNFDEDGNFSKDEDGGRRKFRETIPTLDGKTLGEDKNERRRQKRRLAAEAEAREFVEILPGVRSIAFYPLWDSHQERWFAGCLVYSTDILRVLVPDDDLVYLAAFGNSIMAEVSRLNALVAAQMKLNFVSSISHELRSPLHGILASTEFLQDTNLNPPQADMVITINACGRTLLDTIDHVLDFTKLNAVADTKAKKVKKGRNRRASGKAPPLHTSTQSDISVLTEEVIESVYAGHKLNKSTVRRHSDCHANPGVSQVSLIVDISHSRTWLANMEPGAWRRILMNLVSNALKYTENGYIKINLEKIESPNNSEVSTVILSVSDSGKGISESFLQHHLYTPFAQEDSLSVGTGLGLSIVWQLVEDLRGAIDFQSEQGMGTDVKITLPVANPKTSSIPPNADPKILSEIQAKTQGMRACLIGFNSMPVEATGILSPEVKGIFSLGSSVSKLLRDWFGMLIVHSANLDISAATISCVMESSLNDMSWGSPSQETLDDRCLFSPGMPSKPLLIVICTSISHERSYTTQKGGWNLVYIQQPLGPQKLSFVLARCFTNEVSRVEKEAPPTDHGYFDHYTNTSSHSNDLDIPLKSPHLETPSPSSIHTTACISHSPSETSTSERSTPKIIPKSRVANQRPGAHRQNVLLVEDNAINLKLLVTYMKKLGFDYATAVNGLEAFKIFRDAKLRFDIILMDVNMPVMDGMQSTRLIRQLEMEMGQKAVTIIALTGAASETARQAAFSAGIDLFLTKPVPMKTLKTILEENEEDMKRFIRSEREK